MNRKERKKLNLNTQGKGESQTLTNADVATVTAAELTGNTDANAAAPVTSEANPAPAGETLPPAEPVALSERLAKLSMAKAPEKAAVVVAPKGEATRAQPMKLNHGINERGVRTNAKGISNGGRRFKVGKGNGSKDNTVWGHTLVVAKELASSKADGIFTAQELYEALFQVDWQGKGITRVKYTQANAVAYAGWIESLVKGAPSKSFAIVEPVADTVEA